MTPPLRVALVRGPMYDHLYPVLDEVDAEIDIVVHEDHPTLNRRVAELVRSGEVLDLISTHAKYTPAQSPWLHPLDDLVAQETIAALAPRAVELCQFQGRLWCLPRLIDVRLLWTRTDRVGDAPDTWAELVTSSIVFGFPGRESGLFGTFFELVVGAGGQLFDADGRPSIESEVAIGAVELLCRLAQRAPPDLPQWLYDDVDRALLDGRIDAAAVWPGAWGAIARSETADRLSPHPYLAGPHRRVSYSGCHGWAIPRTSRNVGGALEVLQFLMGVHAQTVDAAGGNISAHTAVMSRVTPADDLDRRRLEITRRTIDESMITYPPSHRFPEIEDAGSSALHDALTGHVSAAAAVARIQHIAHSLSTTSQPRKAPA